MKSLARFTIQPCDIRNDLIRRDFTINSMAVYLVPPHYGELIDPGARKT
jgi:tRNA nucleotidyltransferase/poly(A) polymerase